MGHAESFRGGRRIPKGPAGSGTLHKSQQEHVAAQIPRDPFGAAQPSRRASKLHVLLVQEHHPSSQLGQVPLPTLGFHSEGFLGFVSLSPPPLFCLWGKVQKFLTASKRKALIYLS